MDLFKLGMRNFFGIVLPGAILLLVLSYGFFTIASALGRPPHYGPWMANFQSLILIVLFLLSYLFGSLMRLNSAEKLDEKSGRLDTLLDAFYLVHRHAKWCDKCSAESPKVTGDSAAS